MHGGKSVPLDLGLASSCWVNKGGVQCLVASPPWSLVTHRRSLSGDETKAKHYQISLILAAVVAKLPLPRPNDERAPSDCRFRLFTGAAQCLLRLSPAPRPFVVLKASEFRTRTGCVDERPLGRVPRLV